MSGLPRGLVRERACRGGAEGEARSAVLYWGSLTVPRAKAAGTRGRGVPGDGAWHWDIIHKITPHTYPFWWCAHHWGYPWGIGDCYPSRTPSLLWALVCWPGGLIPSYPYSKNI